MKSGTQSIRFKVISLIFLTATLNLTGQGCGKDKPPADVVSDAAPDAARDTTPKKLRPECSAPPKAKTVLPNGAPILTDPQAISLLYQGMKDTHEILDHNGIIYWIEGGSLVGAIRHHGIIPWDDDTDLTLYPGEEERFEKLIPLYQAIGYNITFGKGSGYTVRSTTPDMHLVDLFLSEKRADKVYLQSHWSKCRNGEEVFIRDSELFPLKKYTFGLLQIPGPRDPSAWLASFYGEDWLTEGAQTHLHHHDPNFKPIQFKITDKNNGPALPLGPLLDRVP